MESVLQFSDDTVEHASSASDFSASRSIFLMHLVSSVTRYSQTVVHAAQMSETVEVELDEKGRGCAVETDIGRIELGQLCTILWEYDEYGESTTGCRWPLRGSPLLPLQHISDLYTCK